MIIYLLPGLAADHRVFHHIRVPSGYTTQCLKWVKPDKEDTLPSYALKMAKQIDRSKPFVLLGLSMGGMLAVEIAKQIPVHKLILISSIPTHTELPSWYRWGYKYGGKLVLQPVLVRYAIYVKRFFTSESKEDKALIKRMAAEMDSIFVHKCIQMILDWRTASKEINAIRIHGTADWILPLKNSKADYIVDHAGHLMIFDRHKEINQLLIKILS